MIDDAELGQDVAVASLVRRLPFWELPNLRILGESSLRFFVANQHQDAKQYPRFWFELCSFPPLCDWFLMKPHLPWTCTEDKFGSSLPSTDVAQHPLISLVFLRCLQLSELILWLQWTRVSTIAIFGFARAGVRECRKSLPKIREEFSNQQVVYYSGPFRSISTAAAVSGRRTSLLRASNTIQDAPTILPWGLQRFPLNTKSSHDNSFRLSGQATPAPSRRRSTTSGGVQQRAASSQLVRPRAAPPGNFGQPPSPAGGPP